MSINDDQYRSILLNASQCRSIFIELYFGSIPEIWSVIDRYWSALIIDTVCPDLHDYMISRILKILLIFWEFISKIVAIFFTINSSHLQLSTISTLPCDGKMFSCYRLSTIRVVLHNDHHFYKDGICKCLRWVLQYIND